MAKQSMLSMILCGIVSGILSVIISKAIKYMKITDSMTLMGKYQSNIDVLYRILLYMIPLIVIRIMFCVIQNCKIPLLTKLGKNFLLIYLVHSCDYLLQKIPYKSYENVYIIYAAITSMLICVIFSSEKINRGVLSIFNKTMAVVLDKTSIAGKRIKYFAIVIFLLLLCLNAKDTIIGVRA